MCVSRVGDPLTRSPRHTCVIVEIVEPEGTGMIGCSRPQQVPRATLFLFDEGWALVFK